MIPVEIIKLRRTPGNASLTEELARRLEAYSPCAGATFSSVRYSRGVDRRWVARSWFKIPYLPVLVQRSVGSDVSVVARPSIVELVGVAIIVMFMGYASRELAVLAFAAGYHVVGYVCFKLAVGDLRPLLADLVDERSSSIGWA
jgi:hypothetical protein